MEEGWSAAGRAAVRTRCEGPGAEPTRTWSGSLMALDLSEHHPLTAHGTGGWGVKVLDQPSAPRMWSEPSLLLFIAVNKDEQERHFLLRHLSQQWHHLRAEEDQRWSRVDTGSLG